MAYQLSFMKFFILGGSKSLEIHEKNESSPDISEAKEDNLKTQPQPAQMSSASVPQLTVSQLTPRQALLIAYEIARRKNTQSNNGCAKTDLGQELLLLKDLLPKEFQSKNKQLSKLLKLEDNQTLFKGKNMVSLSPLGISCLEKEMALVNAVINQVTAVLLDKGK